MSPIITVTNTENSWSDDKTQRDRETDRETDRQTDRQTDTTDRSPVVNTEIN